LILLFDEIDFEKYLGYAICMSSLQGMSSFLFINMTGSKVVQRTQVVSTTLLHDAKPVLGLFCLNLNTIGQRDSWLGFKNLRLGLRIRADDKALGWGFRFRGLRFRARI